VRRDLHHDADDPRAAKSTNGRTSTLWVSDPALACTEMTVPTGTPCTSGWSPTRVLNDQLADHFHRWYADLGRTLDPLTLAA
jgi:hypothetical protein